MMSYHKRGRQLQNYTESNVLRTEQIWSSTAGQVGPHTAKQKRGLFAKLDKAGSWSNQNVPALS